MVNMHFIVYIYITRDMFLLERSNRKVEMCNLCIFFFIQCFFTEYDSKNVLNNLALS